MGSEVTTTTTHLFHLYTYLFIARGLIRSNYDDYTFVPLIFIPIYGQEVNQK